MLQRGCCSVAAARGNDAVRMVQLGMVGFKGRRYAEMGVDA